MGAVGNDTALIHNDNSGHQIEKCSIQNMADDKDGAAAGKLLQNFMNRFFAG